MGAAREQSRGEGEVVAGGRDEPAAPPFERPRARPPPPRSTAGGGLHCPSGPSSTTDSPVAALSRSYAVANRPMLSPPTLKAVSFIPSGSQIPSRRASPKHTPA